MGRYRKFSLSQSKPITVRRVEDMSCLGLVRALPPLSRHRAALAAREFERRVDAVRRAA